MMLLAVLSWLAIGAFGAIVIAGLSNGMGWAHLPLPGAQRTQFAAIAILALAAIFFFAWLAPSANVLFRRIASGGNILGTILAVIGVTLLILGKETR